MHASLSEIADLVQGTIVGDGNLNVIGLSPIDAIETNTLVFAEGSDKLKCAEESSAAAVLVGRQVEVLNKPLIQVADPLAAFVVLIQHYYPEIKPQPIIHPTACLADDVQLGENVCIGAYVVIESGTCIGDGCVIKSHVHIGHHVMLGAQSTIHPHVTIYDRSVIGARVCIHASTVIGSDGFGYTYKDGKHVKTPHAGHVLIGDDVEIGANTVVDRATLGATAIGAGTKIDNLVQVAHSVTLGKNNILCAFTGIAGSTKCGDNVIFAANVGVSDHVRIDDGVILGARTGVPPRKHLKQGSVYLGSPARTKDKTIEIEMALARTPMMRKKLQNLLKRIERLEACSDGIEKD